MTVKLHREVEKRLRDALLNALRHTTVGYGFFVLGGASETVEAGKVLPEHGTTHDVLTGTLGDAPFFIFVRGTLGQELYDASRHIKDGQELPLQSVFGYEDLEVVADRLLSSFKSLPYKYVLTVELPKALAVGLRPWVAIPGSHGRVSLAVSTPEFRKQFPTRSGIESRDREIIGGAVRDAMSSMKGLRAGWENDGVYLQIKMEGLIAKYVESLTLQQAMSSLRSYFGLGLATGLFETQVRYGESPAKLSVVVHQASDQGWTPLELQSLQPAQLRTLHNLKIGDSGNDLASHELWIKRKMEFVEGVFEAGEPARKVILAAQWLFDSYCGEDELLAFIQAAVVLEILLGDKAVSDQTGLSVLLANRCAYLISHSHRERTELLSDFKKIYDVRSQIVHGGHSRLTPKERDLFNKLRSICSRILNAEIRLLREDMLLDRAAASLKSKSGPSVPPPKQG